jgi:hypothetical protein
MRAVIRRILMSHASTAILALLFAALVACTPQPSSPVVDAARPSAPPAAVGGGCEYRKYEGKCMVTGLGDKPTFTFEGMVEGTAVKAEGNEVEAPNRQSFSKVQVGASADCTLEFISRGTCTPCMLSHGSCGKAAWDAFRAHPR